MEAIAGLVAFAALLMVWIAAPAGSGRTADAEAVSPAAAPAQA